MGQFDSIVVRSNGEKILHTWFNAIRTAGIAVEAALGGGVTESTFTIANNQASATDVTSLTFSGYRSFELYYSIYRNTTGGGATELAEVGKIMGTYKTVAATWEMAYISQVGDAGVEFSITSAGQVQYTSTNITGTPASSTMKYKYQTTAV